MGYRFVHICREFRVEHAVVALSGLFWYANLTFEPLHHTEMYFTIAAHFPKSAKPHGLLSLPFRPS